MKKQNKFEELLLHNKVVDHRNLYVILSRKRFIVPSFTIMVMGLYKEKLVFFKISTSYRLIKFIEDIEIKTIQEFNIKTKKVNPLLNIIINKKVYKYDLIENIKDIYSIKKIIGR